MDHEHTQLIQSKLQPGEQVLWWGQPDARRMMVSYLLSGWAFIAVIGGSIALIGRVNIMLVAVFALLMMGIMLGMALLMVYPDEKRTLYVLTDRRALFLKAGRPKFQQQIEPHDFGPLKVTERKDGTGDIYFASEGYRHAQKRTGARHFGFFYIPDVRAVEQHMQHMLPRPDVEPAHETGQHTPEP
jgi:hypothetical protein